MICHNCGNKVVDGAVFCPKCGAEIIENDFASQPPKISAMPHTVREDLFCPKCRYTEIYPVFETETEVSGGGYGCASGCCGWVSAIALSFSWLAGLSDNQIEELGEKYSSILERIIKKKK